jgi:hypothetical protein
MPSEFDKYLDSKGASPETREKFSQLKNTLQSKSDGPIQEADKPEKPDHVPQGEPPPGSPSGKLDPATASTIQNTNDAPQGDSYNRSSRVNEPSPSVEPKKKDSLAKYSQTSKPEQQPPSRENEQER